MANQPELISMAQQFTGLPMKDLIGAPLLASADANHQMALTQVEYLMSTCFKKVTSGKTVTYEPVMIEMILKRGVITPGNATATPPVDTKITTVTSTIELPILTILPLNSLAVDNVSINFVMEVSSSYTEEHTKEEQEHSKEEGSLDAKFGNLLWNVELKGSVSHDQSKTSTDSSHYEKKNHATYTVDVHAGQLPLPPGVGIIIQAYANNISPIQMPTTTPLTPPNDQKQYTRGMAPDII
jgi:hypothetical protein